MDWSKLLAHAFKRQHESHNLYVLTEVIKVKHSVQCLGLVFRIRVRVRVSFLSRPIHCKHLSLIESTTARVTSPVLISSLNDIIELNEPNLFCFHNVLWKPNHFLVSLSPDINCFVPSCSLPNRSGTTVTRVKRNTKGNNIFAYSWCVFLLIFLVHCKITCIQEAF